jgi:WD repeat-containing protein 76
MARAVAPLAEQSDFEKQRLANIAERDALLKKLTQEAAATGLYSKPASAGAPNGTKRAKKSSGPPAKRVKREADVQPRRTSSRIAGIQADSEVAKEKADKEYEERREEDRQRRMRQTGDLSFADGSLIGTDSILKGVAKPYQRTFDEDDIKETTDKDLKTLRERLSRLELWDAWDPNRIKITPERIYSMSFHPTTSKPIVFAGDKLGNLGIIDASQRPGGNKVKDENEIKVKRENGRNRNPGGSDPEDEDDDDDPNPVINIIKPHTRTISGMHTHPSKPETLYTASYDSSIRATDLQKSVAVEVYGPADANEDDPISGVDMAATDPNVVYFTTLNGGFGTYDTRSPPSSVDTYQLSEKKIGGFTLNPVAPHYLATASLDRTMKLWDLRKISRKLPTLVGEHESKLSVSHAAFNTAGQVATSSYDDTIKIHSFGVSKNSKKGTGALESMATWNAGTQLEEDVMKPEVIVRHNNQTGRWVTILRPQWQRYPSDHIHKFVIGNMNRFVDVFAADGTQLAQLGDPSITAVPAVAVWHEAKEWIAAGTASGKLCLWM